MSEEIPDGWDKLIRSFKPDPPEAPPQRGHIEPRYAWHLKTIIKVAESIGARVLGVENALDKDVPNTPESQKKVDAAFQQLLQGGQLQLGDIPAPLFLELVHAELFGLGPLERFLRRQDINEVMVNGPYIVFIERKGKLWETGHKFLDDAHVERIIRRIVRPLGRDIGPANPLVDARLADGSRVNAIVAPCALDGPSVTIRKFSQNKLTMSDMVSMESLSPEMARFLAGIVVARQNVIVSGGTGSGKTTLINALSQFIPEGERVVTIEDAAELKLAQRNVVRMESKKPSIENPTAITIRDCLVNALRMRPERILIGECRSFEALDMLQAMNTGHDGSMTTVHANTPRDAISRLETLAMMAGLDLPVLVLRKQICSAVHYVIQAARLRDGSRKVTHITEVQRMEGDNVLMSDIFEFKEEGMVDGKIIGRHVPSGVRPAAIGELERVGVKFPPNFFMPKAR